MKQQPAHVEQEGKLMMIGQSSGLMHSDNVKSDTTKTVKGKKKQLYTCKMDPDVISDKPGNCPKCGMKLVPLKAKK